MEGSRPSAGYSAPRSQGSSWSALDVEQWLRCGAMLGLDDQRIAIAVGPFTRHAEAPSCGSAWFAPDFYLDDPLPWWQPASYLEMPISSLVGALSVTGPPPQLRFRDDDGVAFRERVAAWLSRIHQGELEKAVPVAYSEAALTPTLRARLHPWMVARAVSSPRGLRPYGLWDGRSGRDLQGGETSAGATASAAADSVERARGLPEAATEPADRPRAELQANSGTGPSRGDGSVPSGLVGATPERLFSVADGVLHTIALAGTRRCPVDGDADTLARDLLSDPKDRHEHQLVVDDLRRELAAFGEVTVDALGVRALPGLLHLETRLRCAVDSTAPSFAALAAALHPTPALGTSPRRGALTRLRAHDDLERRGRLGAPFGLRRPNGSLLCVVAIRGLQWTDNRVLLASGCGVVRGSNIDAEWQEVLAKRNSVLDVFGLG